MPVFAPHLWYATQAEEAARFYVSIFPDSRIDRVTRLPAESPAGPAGSVAVVEFTLMGAPVMAIAAGPLDPFNHAISLVVQCDTQAEIDSYWEALLQGGAAEQCGWVRDRYGVCWQITPRRLGDMMASPDRAAAARAAGAMLTMVKLDLPKLEAAFKG